MQIPSKPLDIDNTEFLSKGLYCNLPSEANGILCSVASDPNKAEPGEWRPRRWRYGMPCRLPHAANNYAAISSFRNASDGTARRHTELFVAAHALMVDDLVEKVDFDMIVKAAMPSAIMRTSPKSYQGWYFLDEPFYNAAMMRSAIAQFITKRLLGSDPGMAGINRVGRIIGTNTKQKYGPGGFATHFVWFEPDCRYSMRQLCRAFGLIYSEIDPRIAELRRRQRNVISNEAVLDHRVEDFNVIVEWAEGHGLFKARGFNAGGWREISCPWRDLHSDRADTGAAIASPSEENGYYGGFQCHHGHCIDRTWSDFSEWVANAAFEEVAEQTARFVAGQRHIRVNPKL